MSNPEVERAAEALRNWVRFYEHEKAAEKLSTLNLLRTEADRLNAELADVMVALRKKRGCFNVTPHCVDKDWRAMCVALDAILDSRKPKERWTVGRTSSLGVVWAMRDGANAVGFPSDAEPEARAYVDRKNAEEAK